MYTYLDQYDIYYEVHGQGKPLIILNGIMMSTQSWHQFIKPLEGYQLILLDFIDQGKSSRGQSYSHDLQVSVLKRLVDMLSLDEVNIIGVSYGGQIALQYAIKHKVDALMVCNAALYTSPWLSDIGKAWQSAALKGDKELFYHVTIPYIYSHHYYNNHIDWMNERKSILMDVFDDLFFSRIHRLIESSETYDVRSLVHQIDARTHVVSSEFDYLTPADETYQIAKHIESSAYTCLKNCGHASMYEKPDRFVEIIKSHFVLNHTL